MARQGNDLYAEYDGNVYRNSGSGWQKQTSGGGQSASGYTSWANREQQAHSDADSRFSSFRQSWASRGGGGWGDRFGGGRFGGFRR